MDVCRSEPGEDLGARTRTEPGDGGRQVGRWSVVADDLETQTRAHVPHGFHDDVDSLQEPEGADEEGDDVGAVPRPRVGKVDVEQRRDDVELVRVHVRLALDDAGEAEL